MENKVEVHSAKPSIGDEYQAIRSVSMLKRSDLGEMTARLT